MAAAILAPKLKDLLLGARAASLVTVEEAFRIRDVMYVEMEVYEHLAHAARRLNGCSCP